MRREEEEKRRKGEKEIAGVDSSFILHPSSFAAPWHRASYARFLRETLPQLLVSRVPLVGYGVESAGEYACRVTIEIGVGANTLKVTFTNVPQPDADGVFVVNGKEYVVLPIASSDELEQADIQCAGEQLHACCAARLGEAPLELEWDENLLRTWLPLETWVEEFIRLRGQAVPKMPWEAKARWLERHTQLRRIVLPDNPRMFTQGHFGRDVSHRNPGRPECGADSGGSDGRDNPPRQIDCCRRQSARQSGRERADASIFGTQRLVPSGHGR